uniref:Uncharacterized protein n=1 Tax=Ciona intestinalis TaxID=7719 RepID=H2Y2V7_CIOIN
MGEFPNQRKKLKMISPQYQLLPLWIHFHRKSSRKPASSTIAKQPCDVILTVVTANTLGQFLPLVFEKFLNRSIVALCQLLEVLFNSVF